MEEFFRVRIENYAYGNRNRNRVIKAIRYKQEIFSVQINNE